jgi:hypothetical protein
MTAVCIYGDVNPITDRIRRTGGENENIDRIPVLQNAGKDGMDADVFRL